MANATVLYDLFGSDDDSESLSEGHELHEDSNINLESENLHNFEEDNVNDVHDEDAFDEMVREGPKEGMVFDSAERLHEAYNSFANAKGFCVFCRSRNNKYIVLSCDRGGVNNSKRLSKKNNCGAHINTAIRELGRWEVTSVSLDHNHELDPNMSALMAGHRRLSMKVKRRLEANDIAGAPVSKNIKMVEVEAGPDNLGATARDCRNFIDERRRLRLVMALFFTQKYIVNRQIEYHIHKDCIIENTLSN